MKRHLSCSCLSLVKVCTSIFHNPTVQYSILTTISLAMYPRGEVLAVYVTGGGRGVRRSFIMQKNTRA